MNKAVAVEGTVTGGESVLSNKQKAVGEGDDQGAQLSPAHTQRVKNSGHPGLRAWASISSYFVGG